ncbi:MAG TPA: extracellular solute-binding protein [Clostridiaceae bacterium]|nr:extracellular solute-binding protein [Clostridiaceae bacterium]
MRKKRLSILALVLAAMFVFSACGGTSPSGTSTPTDSSKPDTGDPSVTKKDVVLWNRIFEEWNQEYFQRMGEEFNADPNNKTVNLIQEFVPGDAWDEKMKSAQAAGTAPDTYVQNYGNVIWGAAQGLLQPLDDYVPQDAWDDLMDNVKEFVSYKGKYYAYPQLVEPAIVLFYRADLFEQAGLDPNKPPKTWDELIEYAKKLTTDDVFGLGIPGFGPNVGWATWGWQLQAAGHLALSDDWTKATVTDQGYVDFVNFWKRLYDEKVVPEQPLSDYTEMLPYGQGALAMKLCGSWGLGQLANDYPEILEVTKVAVAPTKDGKQDRTTSTVGGWTYVLDAKARNPEGAGEYIYWLLGSDQKRCADFFKVAGYSKYPPRKSVNDYIMADPEASKNESMKIISEKIVPYAAAEPLYAWEISMEINAALENVILNGMSAEEALKLAEQNINKFIEDNDVPSKKP